MRASFPAWLRQPSLRLTLLAIIMLVLLPTLGVIAVTLLNAGRSLRDASAQQLQESAHSLHQSVASELEVMSRLLLRVAGAWPDMGVPPGRIVPLPVQIGERFDLYQLRRENDAWAMPGQYIMAPEAIGLIKEAARTGKAQVSNFLPPAPGDPDLRIMMAVPGDAGESTRPVVTITARPADLIRSLARKHNSAGSVILAVTDGNGRIIGRSVEGEKFIGREVPDWQELVALGTDSGSFHATTIEGGEIIFAFSRIEGTPGWVAVVGENVTSFDQRWQQPILVMIVASGTTILLSLIFAGAFARRVLRPIRSLALRARRIASSETPENETFPVAVPPSFVAEFEALRISLDEADRVLRGSLAESRQTEQALRQNNLRLRQTEKLARVGSWSIDLATMQVACSDLLLELNGRDPADPPLHVQDLAQMLPPDHARRLEELIRRCIELGEPYGIEVEHLRKDGGSFAAYIQGEAIRDEAGRIVRISGTLQDISERKEQSERLAALADNLPLGAIFRLERSAGGDITAPYVSGGIEAICGFSAHEVMTRPALLKALVLPQDRRGMLRACLRSQRRGQVLDCSLRLLTRQGRAIWVHCRAAVRLYPEGRVVWDGLVRDITAEREVEEALRTAKDSAETAERAKSDFLATMSHEIRTPMNSVIGMTRLALQTELSKLQRNYLQKINESASILLGIINDILDFSKIEAGGLELEGTVFRLESVLETVASVTVLKAAEKGLEITFAVSPETPSRFRGDPLRLGQVLTNLVGNAVKFTQSGDVVIGASPIYTPQNQIRGVLFSVRDTGIGMSDSQIEGLFRPFSQASRDTSRKFGGTGLGLAICRRLVEMMGGEIWVQSAPDEGSTFFFTVEMEPAVTDSAPVSGMRLSGGLRARRILIVDDNAFAREALAEMVGAFGMVTRLACDGVSALRALREAALSDQPFDIVLLDWRMPGMDGLELAREIKADKNLVRMPALLMVTAFGQENAAAAADEAGLQGILMKPVTPSLMFNTILVTLALGGESGAAPPAPAGDNTQFAALSGRKVLVVDDNALNREVATDFLALVGVRCDSAVDGLDALRKLGTGTYDAVLMDVHMPEMNGLEAVREIRSRPEWADLPVVALTAQARPEDQRISLEAGMTCHLTKPIDETALYRTLMRLIVAGGGAPAGAAPERFAPDLPALQRRFGGNPQRIQRLMKGFIRDFGSAPDEFSDLVARGAMTGVADLAHRVKGVAGYFGADALTAMSGQIETAARRGDAAAVQSVAAGYTAGLRQCLDGLAHALEAQQAGGNSAAPPTLAPQEALDLAARAAPLIQQGDYGARALLEQLSAECDDPAGRGFAAKSLEFYDDLDIGAALAELARLQDLLARGQSPRHEDHPV